MTRLETIQARQDAIRARLLELKAISGPEDGEEGEAVESARAAYAAATIELDALLDEWDKLETERAPLQKRADAIDAISRVPAQGGTTERGAIQAPSVLVRNDPFDVIEDRSIRGSQRTKALVDANLRAIEGHHGSNADEAHFETILKRHASDHRWAENILERNRPEYVSGFAKLMTGRPELLDNAERTAVNIGTSSQGAYLLPTPLDPTLMITNSGSSNVLRAAGTRKVTLTEGNIWYGVTTAGVTASWDSELSEVSDDSPTVGSQTITCYQGQAFVQASVQAFDDIANLQSDVMLLFADAKDRLEGAAQMTGSGSSQPYGLFTVINASSTLQTTSTTAAVIGEVDVHALYRALPIRWRGNGTFVANPLYTLAIKRLGTAIASTFSGDLTQPTTDRILGRPVLESDDAPTTQTTTALDQEVCFADLSQFVIVDKPGGTSIEFIPTLFSTSNNLPKGARGWYMRWRSGSGMPNLAAGRILVDKTSA